jgi:hypothetical protein
MADLLLYAEKGGQQQDVALKKSNFGIHLWPKVTRMTLMECGMMGVIWQGDFNYGVNRDLKHS